MYSAISISSMYGLLGHMLGSANTRTRLSVHTSGVNYAELQESHQNLQSTRESCMNTIDVQNLTPGFL